MDKPQSGDPLEPGHRPASRLSQSGIWKWQRDFFHQQGIGAWRTATVPHYATNNPALAHAYAELVFGFLRDCLAARQGEAERADAESPQPFYIIELGAGSGRFGYLFLKRLLDTLRRFSSQGLSIKYVLTDFTGSNVEFWRAHPALRPFIEQGQLDFAVFDVERDHELRLLQGGETLSPGTLHHPLIVLANYVFDSIGQDAFIVEDGHLSECLISLGSEEPDTSVPSSPFEGLEYQFVSRRTSSEYYPEPEFNEILSEYARTLDRTTVLFPCSALRCLQRLAKLSSGQLLLLTGDKGYVEEEDLRGLDAPRLALHGSFSLMVNYHAITAYMSRRAGRVLKMQRPHASLCVLACVLGSGTSGCTNLERSYDLLIAHTGPDDFFVLRRALHNHLETLTPEELLALIRASHDDPRVLRDCVPALLRRLAEISDRTRHEILRTERRVWDNYYHIGEEEDLAFELGVLLFALGYALEAASLFQRSLQLYGDNPSTLWNVGLCYYRLDMQEQASRFFGEARRRDPDFYPTGALQLTASPPKARPDKTS